MDLNRRKFIKDASLVSAGVVAGISGVSATSNAMSAQSYRRIIGSNDRLNVGIVGFSSRAKSSLIPAFQQHPNNRIVRLWVYLIYGTEEGLKVKHFWRRKLVTPLRHGETMRKCMTKIKLML